MKLTKDNYFSLEASRHYMSVSQFKDFTPAFGGCEAGAVAKLNGEYEQPYKKAFEEGHFVHAWNEGTLDEFKANNPDLYSSQGPTKGELKTNFKHCLKMIEILENDPLVMKVLSGQKEVILTAELFGIPWKVMLDSYQPETGVFADLKALKDVEELWNKQVKAPEPFFQFYGYDVQMAVYAEVEKLHTKRDQWLFPHLVVVTKEKVPDHEIIWFDWEAIERLLSIVGVHIERVKLVKSGQVEPIKCGKCDYCKDIKKLARIKYYAEFNTY